MKIEKVGLIAGNGKLPELFLNQCLLQGVEIFSVYLFLNILLKNDSFFLPGIVISTFSPKILLAISIYAFPEAAFLLATAGSPLFV